MAKEFRFELDRENKILLMRFLEKRLTDESLAEVYAALREYVIATEPYAAIVDFSAAIQVDLSRMVKKIVLVAALSQKSLLCAR